MYGHIQRVCGRSGEQHKRIWLEERGPSHCSWLADRNANEAVDGPEQEMEVEADAVERQRKRILSPDDERQNLVVLGSGDAVHEDDLRGTHLLCLFAEHLAYMYATSGYEREDAGRVLRHAKPGLLDDWISMPLLLSSMFHPCCLLAVCYLFRLAHSRRNHVGT